VRLKKKTLALLLCSNLRARQPHPFMLPRTYLPEDTVRVISSGPVKTQDKDSPHLTSPATAQGLARCGYLPQVLDRSFCPGPCFNSWVFAAVDLRSPHLLPTASSKGTFRASSCHESCEPTCSMITKRGLTAKRIVSNSVFNIQLDRP